MKIKEVNLENFEEIVLESIKPCAVVFTSSSCYLCKALNPIIARLLIHYQNKMLLFQANADKEKKLMDFFLEKNSGVPSIVLFKNGTAQVLSEPENSDKDSWYSEEYLLQCFDHFIETFRGER